MFTVENDLIVTVDIKDFDFGHIKKKAQLKLKPLSKNGLYFLLSFSVIFEKLVNCFSVLLAYSLLLAGEII